MSLYDIIRNKDSFSKLLTAKQAEKNPFTHKKRKEMGKNPAAKHEKKNYPPENKEEAFLC